MACDFCSYAVDGEVYQFSWTLMCTCGYCSHPMIHGDSTYQRYKGYSKGQHHFLLLGEKPVCPESGIPLRYIHLDCENFDGYNVTQEYVSLDEPATLYTERS